MGVCTPVLGSHSTVKRGPGRPPKNKPVVDKFATISTQLEGRSRSTSFQFDGKSPSKNTRSIVHSAPKYTEDIDVGDKSDIISGFPQSASSKGKRKLEDEDLYDNHFQIHLEDEDKKPRRKASTGVKKIVYDTYYEDDFEEEKFKKVKVEKEKKVNNSSSGEMKAPRDKVPDNLTLEQFFKAFDKDNDGYISYNEFIVLMQYASTDPTHPPNVFENGCHTVNELKKIFDEDNSGKNTGKMDMAKFMGMYQTCVRCLEVRKRKFEDRKDDGIPDAVLVRQIPTTFEADRCKGCHHYQWTWCNGFETTGNAKCKGSYRHAGCPKYLANCTLWKVKKKN